MSEEEKTQAAHASMQSKGRSGEDSSGSGASPYRFVISCGLEKENAEED